MLHWTPAKSADPVITPVGDLIDRRQHRGAAHPCARADHARMLAHAAKRRLSATGDEGAYWKACAPAALSKAAAIRAAGLTRLP